MKVFHQGCTNRDAKRLKDHWRIEILFQEGFIISIVESPQKILYWVIRRFIIHVGIGFETFCALDIKFR